MGVPEQRSRSLIRTGCNKGLDILAGDEIDRIHKERNCSSRRISNNIKICIHLASRVFAWERGSTAAAASCRPENWGFDEK